jgi:hypothetical protein
VNVTLTAFSNADLAMIRSRFLQAAACAKVIGRRSVPISAMVYKLTTSKKAPKTIPADSLATVLRVEFPSMRVAHEACRGLPATIKIQMTHTSRQTKTSGTRSSSVTWVGAGRWKGMPDPKAAETDKDVECGRNHRSIRSLMPDQSEKTSSEMNK